jgi:hypothetical protein
MSAPSLYGRVTPLLRDRHLKLRYRSRNTYEFATQLGAIPIVAGEFAEISREYPIVFAQDAKGNLGSAALVGTRDGRNLYLNADHQWDARYIPAFVRRYPFVFGEADAHRVIVCIDESSPDLGETQGDRLFEDNGEATATLQLVLNLLHEYQRQSELTRAFVRRINELKLLQPRSMNASLPDGRAANLDDFLMVDQAKLAAIPDDVLKNLFTTGQLALIYAHLFSVGNFLELARRQEPLYSVQPRLRVHPKNISTNRDVPTASALSGAKG